MIISTWQRYINVHQFPYKIPEDSHFKACQGHMLAHQHLSLPTRHQLDFKKNKKHPSTTNQTQWQKKDPNYLQKLPQKTCFHSESHHPLDPSSLPSLPPKKKTSRDTMKWSFQDPLDRITVLLIIASREAKSLQRVAAHRQTGKSTGGGWTFQPVWSICASQIGESSFPNFSGVNIPKNSCELPPSRNFWTTKIGEKIAVL